MYIIIRTFILDTSALTLQPYKVSEERGTIATESYSSICLLAMLCLLPIATGMA